MISIEDYYIIFFKKTYTNIINKIMNKTSHGKLLYVHVWKR